MRQGILKKTTNATCRLWINPFFPPSVLFLVGPTFTRLLEVLQSFVVCKLLTGFGKVIWDN